MKHSLDSDEEDERDEVLEGGLDDEDLAAQENTTVVRMCESVYVETCGHVWGGCVLDVCGGRIGT